MSDLARIYRETRDRLGPDHPATIAAFQARRREVNAEELAQSAGVPSLWWLSFADTTEGGGGFLGVVVVEAFGFVAAIERVSALGLNPGGEVSGGEIPLGSVDAKYLGRLLNAIEAHAAQIDTP